MGDANVRLSAALTKIAEFDVLPVFRNAAVAALSVEIVELSKPKTMESWPTGMEDQLTICQKGIELADRAAV